jgi:hypothetical protein
MRGCTPASRRIVVVVFVATVLFSRAEFEL